MPETGEGLTLRTYPHAHCYPHTHHFLLTLSLLKWTPILLSRPLPSAHSLLSSNCPLHEVLIPQGIMHRPSHPSPTFSTSLPVLFTLRHSPRMLTVPCTHSALSPSNWPTLFLPPYPSGSANSSGLLANATYFWKPSSQTAALSPFSSEAPSLLMALATFPSLR